MSEDQRLRRLYAQRAVREPDKHNHLDEDQWERLACDELAAGERLSVLAHIRKCPECASIHQGLSRLKEEALELDPELRLESQSVPSRAASSEHWLLRPHVWPVLAAAAALALLVLSPWFWTSRQTAPSQEQEAIRSAPSSRPAPLEPVGVQSELPRLLTWSGLASATSYRVEILSSDGELLWSGPRVETTFLEWPSEVTLDSGRYYWRVLAHLAAGGRPVPSELVAFDLER